MNVMRGTMLGLAMALGTLATSAQNAPIPFRQIERDAQLPARAALQPSAYAGGLAYGSLSGPTTSAGFVRPVAKSSRTLSRGFFLFNGLHLGMAVLDVELTQHCIANHHCVEGNPLMPSSHAGQLGVEFGLVGYGTFVSYKLKQRGSRFWVLSPAIGIAAHTAGVATGIVHR